MRLPTILVIFIVVLLPLSGICQYEKSYAPFPVTDSLNNPYTFPFTGGFNDPKPNLVDIDGDNLVDLLIGEKSGNIYFFKNYGTFGSPDWQPYTERLGGIDIGSWFALCDIDNDGDLDLFCDSRSAKVYFYRNNSSGLNFNFTLEDTAFANISAGNNNTPHFADLDADNDYDFFYGNTTGYLDFYRNDGDSVTPLLVLADNAYDSVYAFPQLKSLVENRHGFSNITFTDIDTDNDLDLFWGDIFNSNIYLFSNLGDSSVSDLVWNTQDYLSVTTPGFNHPTFADIDNDDDMDLVLGVANNADLNNLLLFRNNGIPILANFELEKLNLIRQIDIGSSSVPAIGDLDNDGDNDLLVGETNGQLAYFENTGTVYEPSLKLVSLGYQGIDVGLSAIPELVDWDADGDLDLLIGNQSGYIEYWENTGTISNPVFVQNSSQLAGIKRDQLAIPRAVDLNNNGLVDLVVGEWDFNSRANLLLYQNIGTDTLPVLILADSALLNINLTEFTIPYIYDWDNDNRDDIILAGRLSGLTWYKNIASSNQFPDSTELIAQPDILPGSDDGFRLFLSFGDFDYDGDDDLIVGEENGGLNYYMRSGTCCKNNRGNADGSPDDVADVSDLLYLVDYVFAIPSGPPPPCILEADVTADQTIDVSDLLYLVDFMFAIPAGPAPQACP